MCAFKCVHWYCCLSFSDYQLQGVFWYLLLIELGEDLGEQSLSAEQTGEYSVEERRYSTQDESSSFNCELMLDQEKLKLPHLA